MADEEVTFTEAGKVATGFSFPYVAKYAASAGAITYSGAMELARGVNVTPSPTTSDENKFYANNQEAESAGGKFTGGTVKLTVDGLLTKAERFILGLPEADSNGWTAYGDDAKAPYVGIGYITRWMSGGVESCNRRSLSRLNSSSLKSLLQRRKMPSTSRRRSSPLTCSEATMRNTTGSTWARTTQPKRKLWMH